MTQRTYDQYCGLAHALDLLGERWTMLIIRNLLAGPQRYVDLLSGLPGVGTNLLADRLKALERGGVIERSRLGPPAASYVYALTAYGRDLEPAITALAFWGQRTLPSPRRTTSFQSRWAVLSLRRRFEAGATAGVRDSYQLRVDDDVFTIEVDEGRVDVRQGGVAAAGASAETDAATFFAIASGGLDPAAAIGQGKLRIQGSRNAKRRLASALGVRAIV